MCPSNPTPPPVAPGFTPGPWRVTPPDAGTETRENHLLALCVMKNQRLIARLTQSSHRYADPDELANAALIASAPALYEALADMLAGWRYIRQTHGDLYGVGWDRAEEKAKASLTAARGAQEGA